MDKYCPSGAIFTLIFPASVVISRLSPYSRSPRYTLLLGFALTFCSKARNKCVREAVFVVSSYPCTFMWRRYCSFEKRSHSIILTSLVRLHLLLNSAKNKCIWEAVVYDIPTSPLPFSLERKKNVYGTFTRKLWYPSVPFSPFVSTNNKLISEAVDMVSPCPPYFLWGI